MDSLEMMLLKTPILDHLFLLELWNRYKQQFKLRGVYRISKMRVYKELVEMGKY